MHTDSEVISEAPAKHSRIPVALASLLSIVLITLATVAYVQWRGSGADSDPYDSWPPAGTQQPPPGDTPFAAQGIIALTCRDGKAHIDENIFVGTSLDPDAKPSWFMSLLVDYDQSRNQSECSLYYAPLTQGVTVQALELMENNWSMKVGEYSSNGMSSISANKSRHGIAVLLVNFGDDRIDPGIQVKNGTNGLPAPGRELLTA